MSDFAERMAEERILQALKDGKFENLNGAGKPLPDPGAFTQHKWLQEFIEREELDPLAAAPTVLGLRKEAQQFPQSLDDCDTEIEARTRLEDYNRRVKHNRVHPDPHIPPSIIAPIIDVEGMLSQWHARRAH